LDPTVPTVAPITPLAGAPLAAIRTIAQWYRETVYGRHEGPGTVPFYCDPTRVGPFAVDAADLARGDKDALFRLFVVLAMYQSRRDVDIMRRQRETPARDATGLVTARTLGRRIAASPCELLRSAESFDANCSVKRVFPSGRATCDHRPRTPCHVKDASRTIGRMGDLGKLPTSAWFHLGRGGGLPALYAEACATQPDPHARAQWLVGRLATVQRVGRKLATMFVSTVSTPELAPGLSPWAPAVGGAELVVVDTNLMAAVDRLHPDLSPKTYGAYDAFVRLTAHALACSPRLLQQALYAFRSRSNRAARGDPCAAAPPCVSCVPAVCPFVESRSKQGLVPPLTAGHALPSLLSERAHATADESLRQTPSPPSR